MALKIWRWLAGAPIVGEARNVPEANAANHHARAVQRLE
jgi:hypothetical protein